MPLILVLVLLVGGGTSLAAERSLPGDLFYPVKIGVNEQVRSLFSLSDVAKANWEARRAERRLSETEKLVVKDSLDTESAAELEARFQARAERLDILIEGLRSTDPNDAAAVIAEFQAFLSAHKTALDALARTNRENRDELKDLLSAVAGELRELDKEADDLEDELSEDKSPDTQTAAEGKLKAAENVIAEVGRFIDRMEEKFGAQAVAGARTKLKTAQDSLPQGRVQLQAKAYGEAFVIFQNALRTAQEAKALLKIRDENEVEIRADGTVELETEDEDEEDEELEDELDDLQEEAEDILKEGQDEELQE